MGYVCYKSADRGLYMLVFLNCMHQRHCTVHQLGVPYARSTAHTLSLPLHTAASVTYISSPNNFI